MTFYNLQMVTWVMVSAESVRRDFDPFSVQQLFDFSRVGLGVTSRDLSMTLPVLQTFLCKCPLAPKLLGLE